MATNIFSWRPFYIFRSPKGDFEKSSAWRTDLRKLGLIMYVDTGTCTALYEGLRPVRGSYFPDFKIIPKPFETHDFEGTIKGVHGIRH